MSDAGRTACFIDLAEVLATGAAQRWACIPAALAAIADFNRRGVPVVLLADDCGLDGAALRALLEPPLAEAGAHLDGIWSTDEAPPPRPTLFFRAMRELGLDLTRSWLISSRPDHVAWAANAGLHGIVLLGSAASTHPQILIKQAADLADAPRVMIPRSGGCWHDHR